MEPSHLENLQMHIHIQDELRAKLYQTLEELKELKEWQNTIANRIPESYDDDASQEGIIDKWLDDVTASDEKRVKASQLEILEEVEEALLYPVIPALYVGSAQYSYRRLQEIMNRIRGS
mgnify:CR=1 FL=1